MLAAAIASIGLLTFGSAAAAEPGAVTRATSNGIAWASGGIGDEGLAALRAIEGEYTLSLLFAERSGDYLAGVPVTIADAAGRTLLSATADGPYFLARLPAGRYKVTATHAGQAISREVSVPARGKAEESFHWPAPGR